MPARRPAPRPPGGRHRMRWWVAGIGGLVVVAAVAVALAGGFADRTKQSVPVFAAGDRVDAGEVTLRIQRAWVAVKGPGQSGYDEQQHLFVQAELENTTDAPVPASNTTVWVRVGPLDFGEDPARAVRRSDLAGTGDLQPGLPTVVVYSWPLDRDSVSRGDPMDAGILTRDRKLDDPVFDDAGYGPERPVARVHLKVGGAP